MSDMSKQTHLHKRNSTYYFRAKVPADLRSLFGKAEEKFSLGTKDYHQAKVLARQASANFDRKCASMRLHSQADTPAPLVLTEDTIGDICALWHRHTLAGDEHTRRSGMPDADFDEQSAARQETGEFLRRALARGQLEKSEPALQQFLHLLRLHPTGNADAWEQLRYRFLQTLVETHAQQMQRDAGEPVRTPELPSASFSPCGDALTLDALFEDWEALEADRPDKTVNDMRRTIREFEEAVGQKPAEAITRSDVMTYRNYLVQTLKRKAKTVDKKLTFLCALFNSAIDHERLTTNPAARIPRPKDDSEPRNPFDGDDLRRLFGSPLYREGLRLGRNTGEAGVWLPVLSLYSGAREEELGQLLVADVSRIDGVWCMNIINSTSKQKATDAEMKRLKTQASRRRLPIHPKVIDAGFLAYVKAVKAAGHTRLFPSLKRDRHGKLTSGFSKVFNAYLRELCITDGTKVFHSFRHTFRDACREADIGEELADALMGHSAQKRTGRQYGRSFSVAKLHAAICRINYPGVTVEVAPASTGESPASVAA